MDLFIGVETELEEGKRAATWRGVPVPLYSALHCAGRMTLHMLLLPVVTIPVFVVSAVLVVAVELYYENNR